MLNASFSSHSVCAVRPLLEVDHSFSDSRCVPLCFPSVQLSLSEVRAKREKSSNEVKEGNWCCDDGGGSERKGKRDLEEREERRWEKKGGGRRKEVGGERREERRKEGGERRWEEKGGGRRKEEGEERRRERQAYCSVCKFVPQT